MRYRVIHLTVKPACNPNSLNCIYTRRRNVRTIIIEKQQFYFVVARPCIANNICRPETNNEIERREICSAVLRMGDSVRSVVW